MKDEIWLEGAISVEAAVEAGSREIYEICLGSVKWSKTLRHVAMLAERSGIPVKEVDPALIDELADSRSHGGVIARVGPRRYQRPRDLIPADAEPIIVMLDGVEDPYNFGQAMRSLYAAGVHGMVVRPRNWLSAAGIVARASAGASERLRVAIVENPTQASRFYREHGLLIACATQRRAPSIYDTDLTRPMFLLVGGEKRGVTRAFREHADLHLRIPYGRAFPFSLGAASSTGILAFEIVRQRSQLNRTDGVPRDAP